MQNPKQKPKPQEQNFLALNIFLLKENLRGYVNYHKRYEINLSGDMHGARQSLIENILKDSQPLNEQCFRI